MKKFGAKDLWFLVSLTVFVLTSIGVYYLGHRSWLAEAVAMAGMTLYAVASRDLY